MKVDFTKRQYFDGAMGTMLQQRGLPAGYSPEKWNVENPDAILAVHQAYVAAGCTILKTNTFGSHPLKQGGEARTRELVTAGVKLAKQAASARDNVAVALDMGPSGKLLEPIGDLPFEDAVAQYRAIAEAGYAAGADCVLIETMSDIYECKAAILGVREACDLPICVTLTFNENGVLLTGTDAVTAAVVMESLGASAVGCNCGLGPTQLVDVVRRMAEAVRIPIIANPNAGLPIVHDGKTTFPLDAEAFAAEMNAIASYATHLGGCCGTSPAHIQALAAASLPMPDVTKDTDIQTYISSGRCALAIGRDPVIIGSTLDASTGCAFREALEEDDLYFAQDEALDQDDAGAQALMLNVGIPGIDEVSTLPEAVSTIQELCFLPLMIRTADAAALDAALRIYNGKALVGCINGTAASMELLPIAAKYGCAVVAVPVDENGIPAEACARAAIIERILTQAADCGVARHNVIVDPLFTGDIAVTLETMRLVREHFGIGSILGAAPDSRVTPELLTQAIQAGLSAAVFDPNDEDCTAAYNR